jgi:TonB family protein
MIPKNYNPFLVRNNIGRITIFVLAATLFIGITAFTLNDAGDKKWYSTENSDSVYYSTTLMYDVHGAYDHPVKRNKLNNAVYISDFIEDYPVNWITEYMSVEFIANNNGKEMRTVGKNNILNADQRNFLKRIESGTPLEINVKYRYRNSVTDNLENYQMHTKLMVIPEIEAEYIGGDYKLRNYLWVNAIQNISKSAGNALKPTVVKFTVSETGEIINSKIYKSSGDEDTDILFLNAINKMPKWKPALDENGKNIKQEFEFRVGNDGC